MRSIRAFYSERSEIVGPTRDAPQHRCHFRAVLVERQRTLRASLGFDIGVWERR